MDKEMFRFELFVFFSVFLKFFLNICFCFCFYSFLNTLSWDSECRLYLIMCRRRHGEKAGDEKQEKPNGSIDSKQQTTQSPDVCGEMETTTPMLSGYPTPINRRCSDSGNSSDEPNDVSHA